MAITTASQSQLGQDTAKNSQIVTTSVKLVNSGASTGPSISSIVVTDSGWDALDDTAVGTSNSYIKILGSNFTSTSNVYIGGVQVATANVTYVSASELRVILPPSTAGVSNTVSVFTSTGSGTIAANTLLTSGFPSFTSTSYSASSYTVSTQLLTTGDGTLTYSLKSGSTLPAGLSLAANGLISGTVSGDTTNTFTVLVNDDQLQTTQADITLSVIGTDIYFKNNMLLISADGTNNANNNVFVDSSNNNFAITKSNNVTQGSFSPFSTSGWSNYFDGSGDYITTPYSTTNFDWWTSNFTIEAWIHPIIEHRFWTTPSPVLVGNMDYNSSTQYWAFGVDNSSGRVSFYYYNGSVQRVSSSTNVSLNEWTHIAMTHVLGTGITVFINGVSQGTSAVVGTPQGSASSPLTIGGFNNTYYYGYVSNLHIVKGTAKYTSTFTPSTTQLSAIANTKLLTCQSNRFLDTSNTASSISVYGNSSISNFNPFAPTAVYSTTSYGSSGYFDGTGDYLTVADNAALRMGSGNFTVEYWWYPNSISNYQTPIDKGYTGAGALLFQTGNGDGKIIIYGGGTILITASTAVTVNSWNHMALVRNETALTLYLNGVSVGSNTNSTNFNNTSALGIGGTGIAPGGGVVGDYPINGYLSDVRLIPGTAVYTSAFTPPTAPLTAITNTSLLLKFNNGNIFDATQKNIFETLANAKLSTSVKKYGTASLYLDGNNSYLKSPTTINMGTSDFTIEAWVYPTSRGNADGGVIVGQSRNGIGTDYLLYITQSGYLSGYFLSDASAFYFNSSGTVSLNTWTHVALTRSGSTFKLWINGVNDGTTTSSATITNSNGPLAIGYASNGIGNGQFFGYIDDLRITRGVARYVANFTPPANLQLS